MPPSSAVLDVRLRVATAHLGREPVARLLPHPGEPGLLAALRFGGPVKAPYPGFHGAS